MNKAEFMEIFSDSVSGDIALNELCSMLSTERTFSAGQQEILHLLVHYATDQALRQKDAAYEKYLLENLYLQLSKLGDGN